MIRRRAKPDGLPFRVYERRGVRVYSIGYKGEFQAQAYGTTSAANQKKRRNRALECWRCPECREVYDWEDEAEDCCAEPAPAVTAQPTCPVCAAEYTSRRDAADCCLWKDLDAPTRWRMADAVEAGSTWADELGIAQTATKGLA